VSNVALIGFKNSAAYVQRFIDKKLHPFKHFTRAFINDIIIFSKTAKEHLAHLRQILQLFAELKLLLSPTKSWLVFPLVQLLGHNVNAFSIATIEEQVIAIKNI
jgi:hypothetical protein